MGDDKSGKQTCINSIKQGCIKLIKSNINNVTKGYISKYGVLLYFLINNESWKMRISINKNIKQHNVFKFKFYFRFFKFNKLIENLNPNYLILHSSKNKRKVVLFTFITISNVNTPVNT